MMTSRVVQPVPKPTKLSKDNLTDLLNEAVNEINQIYNLYDGFFTAEEGESSRLEQIEQKLAAIAEKHTELFGGSSPTKVGQVEAAFEEIQTFHKELLTGNDSIKADINDSQSKITDFYNTLFDSSDGTSKDGGQKALVAAAVKSITDFEALINNSATGYKFTIEAAKKDILDAHSRLFDKDKKTRKSVVEDLENKITETHELHTKIKGDIVPFISNQKSEISKIAKDIINKQAEVDSLLSNATVQTLAEGYMQSMQTYGSPVVREYPKKEQGGRTRYLLFAGWCQLKHFTKFIGGYLLFIGPLILIGALFVVDIEKIFGIEINTKNVEFSGAEYILYKLTIALPLLWVSWFGQRSISHKRRLFEEYNHKLRVVQMYMLFTAQKNTYILSKNALSELENELLATIARNPSDVYGKDETMVDKLLDAFGRRRTHTESEEKVKAKTNKHVN